MGFADRLSAAHSVIERNQTPDKNSWRMGESMPSLASHSTKEDVQRTVFVPKKRRSSFAPGRV
jgi:hypothetical protein